ncbi:pilus assembly protein TadG-related protein [Hirschia litorea]|uniref:Pilus assembly protein TadG-related protein n=1 Tax=Hirschia litorea TaxID=1199156 RepID=A0ABW2IMD6_9PROT
MNRFFDTIKSMQTAFLRYGKANGGNVAVTSSLIFGALIALIATTVDISGKTSSHRELQAVADAAALAAAREMAVSAADQVRVQSVASSYIDANWTGSTATTKASLNTKESTITVNVSATSSTISLLKRDPTKETISAMAVAEVSGGGNVCLIGLSNQDQGTLDLKGKSRITATNCQVYSNSNDKYSMIVQDYAQVKMDFVCINGGLKGDPLTLGGDVITSCPRITDPLRDRPPPPFGIADCVGGLSKGYNVNPGKDITLKPGVYCGGLIINGANVEFEPGEYVILNGPLVVNSTGSVEGDGVGFYLSGALSTINFSKESQISLRAPRDGPMAGILFYDGGIGGLTDGLDESLGLGKLGSLLSDVQNKTVGTVLGKSHRITSDNAGVLVGTIYMPYSNLIIDGDAPIADESEYTVIIANAFELMNGSNLVIHTDYHLTDVPVPDGVGPRDVKIRLKS